MDGIASDITNFFTTERVYALLRVVVLVLIGIILARFVSRLVSRIVQVRASPHQAQFVRRLVSSTIYVLTFISALSQLGIDLGVLLGAAGLLTVAVGFAAQASTSNLISGVFLIGERSFEAGDQITVGGITGEVLAVDLMSVKLRTSDNQFVRIPNEFALKNHIINHSRYPIRRIDQALVISRAADFDAVRDLLLALAYEHPLMLAEPRPTVACQAYDDKGLAITFSVWVARAEYPEVKAFLLDIVLDALREAGIALPGRAEARAPAPEVTSPSGS
jgi:small-conductance mechanosensitive channel